MILKICIINIWKTLNLTSKTMAYNKTATCRVFYWTIDQPMVAEAGVPDTTTCL